MKIRVIETRGLTALVEWDDGAGVHRAYVPTDRIENAAADYETLAAGIPFGEAWETLPLGNVGAEQIAQALRARGIWTAEDAQNVNRVRAALVDAYSADLQIILNSLRTQFARRK